MFRTNFYISAFKPERFNKIFSSLKKHQRLYTNEILTAINTPKTIKQIPGPTKWQFFRALAPGGKLYQMQFTDILRRLKKDYGDIILVQGSFGRSSTVIVYDPNDIEKVFRNDDVWPTKNFFETVLYHRKVVRKDLFQDVIGMLPTNGEEWRHVRSVVNPVLMQPKAVKSYTKGMWQVSQEFVERIKDIRDPKTLEVPGDFWKQVNYWALESAMLVVLDKSFGLLKNTKVAEDVHIFLQNLNVFFEVFGGFEIEPPVWKVIATPKFKRLMKSLDGITDFVDKHLQEAVQTIQNKKGNENPNGVPSMLEQLIKIDPKIARVMAIDTLFAGVDTTSSAFVSILLSLAKNPDKQELLRQEILRAFPEKSLPLTEEGMQNMPYLRACIKESLRLYPITGGAGRVLTKDATLGGYLIPKGTGVIMMNIQLLDDPAYFPKPKEFIPERWLRQYKNSPELIGEKSHNFAYYPFGFGARGCVGQRITNLEQEVGIITLLRNFKIEFNHSLEDMFKASIIFIPVKPLLFKFTDL